MSGDKPPKLNLNMGYDFWKNQISSWKVTTDAVEEKWGNLIILHCLEDKLKEELYANTTEEERKAKTGHDTVMKYLDNKYTKKEGVKQYLAFDEFIEYRREQESILDFVEEFERKMNRLKATGCEISDAILAHSLVKNAGLTEEAKGMIKASSLDLSYKSVKDNMLKIYSKSFSSNSSSDYRPIKEECFYNSRGRGQNRFQGRNRNRGNYQSRGSYSGRNNYANRGSYNRSYDERQNGEQSYKSRKNPIDPKTGKPYLCFNCNADDHMLKFCPKPRDRKKTNTKYPTYYTEDDKETEEEVNINLMSL